MTHRERFLNIMEYKPVDRVPNWEVGCWAQTQDRWDAEGLCRHKVYWNWFVGCEEFDLDPREFIHLDTGMKPPFEPVVISRDDRYEVIRNAAGITTRALIEGTSRGGRACMDEYIGFPVECQADFDDLKKRYIATDLTRHEEYWQELRLDGWKNRKHPLILGENCTLLGFYWRMREWMGTEGLSYAFYDEPELIHDMCEFIADYSIELVKPILEKTDADYVMINEDMAMKSGPLLSPKTYKEFIYPNMVKLVSYLKSHGVKYVFVDTDGNSEPLIPLLMDAGVDGLWPLERASVDQDPMFLRKKYGKSLRLTGAVDKRELAKDKKAISEHLKTFIPLIEEGGFIPTVDHTVPPDVSLDNFRYYIEKKQHLLRFEFDKI